MNCNNELFVIIESKVKIDLHMIFLVWAKILHLYSKIDTVIKSQILS